MTQQKRSRVTYKQHLPIMIALVVSVLVGMSGWLPHARQVEILSKLIFAGCGLTWVLLDAERRGVRVGNWMGLLVLVLAPIGLLVWFITYWRTRFWLPLLIYIGCSIASFSLTLLGHFLMGFYFGYPFRALINFL